MGEYGGGVWRCEEVSPHTSALHYGHRCTRTLDTGQVGPGYWPGGPWILARWTLDTVYKLEECQPGVHTCQLRQFGK